MDSHQIPVQFCHCSSKLVPFVKGLVSYSLCTKITFKSFRNALKKKKKKRIPGTRRPPQLSTAAPCWSPCTTTRIMVFYFTSSSGEWAPRPPGPCWTAGSEAGTPQSAAAPDPRPKMPPRCECLFPRPLVPPAHLPLPQLQGFPRRPLVMAWGARRGDATAVFVSGSSRPPIGKTSRHSLELGQSLWALPHTLSQVFFPPSICGLYSGCTLIFIPREKGHTC